MGFGKDLVGNDEQHRAGGESHGVREYRVGDLDRPRAEHGERDLDDSGPDSGDRGVDTPVESGVDRSDRHGESFRDVLNADSDHERDRRADVPGPESDADGQPLGHVVERDGENEQDD